MNLPGFTAERSLVPPRGRYRSSRHVASGSGAVVPAIPNCANCDYILDRCAANGGRPRAVCNACGSGNCYSEQDNSNCWIEPRTGRRICDL
jgi:hypothetical protein